MKKKIRRRNLNIPALKLGRDFLVPMTLIHLGDIYPLMIFKFKNYGQWMMHLNPESDNDFFQGVAVLWRYCTVKTLNKNLFQSIFFNGNISNDCDEFQSHCQRASRISTVSVNFLVAWRKILSYILFFCTRTERAILLALLHWFIKIDFAFVCLHVLKLV